MIKRMLLAMALLLNIQVYAMAPDKLITTKCRKITLHFKNENIGHPTDGHPNFFSKKQAKYISERENNLFIFPDFKRKDSGSGNTNRCYSLNDIKIAAILSFSDGSIIGKNTSLPGFEQYTTLEIPYENQSRIENISYNIQGFGSYNYAFDNTGKIASCSNMESVILGASCISPWSIWNYDNNFYAYVTYPFYNKKQGTFSTFFDKEFKK